MHSKLARAKARRTIKDAKRTSWRQYVSKLNFRTQIKKSLGYDSESQWKEQEV